jgi:twinkle protein
VFSFEEPEAVYVTKLCEKITGKAFGRRKNPADRMKAQDLHYAMNTIEKHYYFIDVHTGSLSIDSVIEKAKELVERKGVNGLIIDPWNCIEQRFGGEKLETQYILESLNKLISFVETAEMTAFLVAHPTKMKPGVIPTLYDVAGSAHFFNRIQNGFIVHQDKKNGNVDVIVSKVKQSWLGHRGTATFGYDTKTRQYTWDLNKSNEKTSNGTSEMPSDGTWRPVEGLQDLFSGEEEEPEIQNDN